MGESWLAKKTVTGNLRDADTQKIKSFSLGGIGFDAKTFPILAGFIDRGKIKVEYDSAKDGMAEYDYSTNTIVLGFTWAVDEVKNALIIHECTHAVYDVANSKMTTAISESIAYVVQCQYLIIKRGEGGKRLSSNNAAKDSVFKLAWGIAAELQVNGKAPSKSDQAALQAAVSQHPFYMAKSAGDAGFNGV
jgi:hypothetical protein